MAVGTRRGRSESLFRFDRFESATARTWVDFGAFTLDRRTSRFPQTLARTNSFAQYRSSFCVGALKRLGYRSGPPEAGPERSRHGCVAVFDDGGWQADIDPMLDPLFVLSGFGVGALVGMTGVGGGSLMTPLLILLFGIHPATAVGTDLLYAAATKTGGSLVHGLARSIEWRVVRALATGSVPATIATVAGLSFTNLDSPMARSVITLVLCAALFMTAGALIFRNRIVEAWRNRVPALDARHTALCTILTGAALGVLVSISSIGAGAIGVVALIILYPQLPMARIVGSDIAHAVPLTLVAGAGHWIIGGVDWHIMGSLLAGSLPGIVLGSYAAIHVPERALRLVLATTLVLVAGRLASDHLGSGSPLITALTGRAPH